MTGFLNGNDDQLTTGGLLADPVAPAPAAPRPVAPPKPQAAPQPQSAPQPQPQPAPIDAGPSWAEVTKRDRFQALTPAERELARSEYFNSYVADKVPPEQRQAAKSMFMEQSKTADYTPPTLMQRAGTALASAGNTALDFLKPAPPPVPDATPAPPADKSLLDQRGAPVSKEFHDATVDKYLSSNAADRAAMEKAPGLAGRVVRNLVQQQAAMSPGAKVALKTLFTPAPPPAAEPDHGPITLDDVKGNFRNNALAAATGLGAGVGRLGKFGGYFLGGEQGEKLRQWGEDLQNTSEGVNADQVRPTVGSAVFNSLGDMSASLPLIYATGGAMGPQQTYAVDVAKFALSRGMTAEAAGILAKGAAETLGDAMITMSPATIPSAFDRYEKLTKAGVDSDTAGKAAFADFLTGTAMGAIPMGAPGKLATRIATGAPVGAAMSAGGTAIQNKILSAYPDQQQDPLSAESLAAGGAIGGLLHGALGHERGKVTVTRTGEQGLPRSEPQFHGTTIDEATGKPEGRVEPTMAPDEHAAGLSPENQAVDARARAAFADLDPSATPEVKKAAEAAQAAPEAPETPEVPTVTEGHNQLAGYLKTAHDGFMEAYHEGSEAKFNAVRSNLVENLTPLLGEAKATEYATHLVDEGGLRDGSGLDHPLFNEAGSALDALNKAAAPAEVAPTEPAASVEAPAPEGKKTKLTPFSHPDLSDIDVRAELAHMADEAGWAQVGGKMMREDATDQGSVVTGRTPWIAKHPWYGAMTERLNEHDTVQAVGKALTGAPMTAKEKRVIANMLDFAKGSLAEREAWAKQARDEVGASSHDEYRQIQAHADRIEALDADIPFAPDDPRLKTLNTDKEIDEAFGIQPKSSGLPEKPVARDAAQGIEGAGTPASAGHETGFQLAGETPAEVKAKVKQTEKTKAIERKAKQDADAKEKADQTAQDIKQRGDAAADNFKLGENADNALSGQKDIFDAPVAAKPKTEKQVKAEKAAKQDAKHNGGFKNPTHTRDGVSAESLTPGQKVSLHWQHNKEMTVSEVINDPKLGHLVRLKDKGGWDSVHNADEITTKAPASDDLSSMFDDIMAEEAGAKKSPIGAETRMEPSAPKKPKTEKEAKALKKAAKEAAAAPVERTPGEAAVSAAKNTAGGLVEAIDGLGALFGANSGSLGSGPVFNEETYAKAKPYFQAAVEHFKGALDDIKEVMRAVIKMVSEKFGGDTAAKMKDYIVRFMQDYREGKTNEPARSNNSEQDRGNDHPAVERDQEAVQDGSGRAKQPGGDAGRDAGKIRDAAGDHRVVHQPGTAVEGAGRDHGILEPAGELQPGGNGGESGDASGGSSDSPAGSAAPDAGPNAAIAEHDAARDVAQKRTFAEKVEAQKAAESIPVKLADRANIDATLPLLQDGQREDVHTAETRFAKPDGFGMLFTNGTGTGKTYLGLGVIKRMLLSGKKNGIVVVPNSEVMREWLMSAPNVGIELHQLADKQDAGKGVAITTYANFGDNATLLDRKHDFVVADEAHNLMANKEATTTRALETLRAITLHPASARQRTDMLHRDLVAKISALRAARDKIRADAEGNMTAADAARVNEIEAKLDPLDKKYRTHLDAQIEHVAEFKPEKRPRALFTSATPFAWEPNIQWAEGFLFNYQKVKQTGAYNEPNPYQAYMIQHFGYRMRTGKLTEPDAKVNRDLMQIQYNKHLRDSGVLSTRLLDVDKDYDRKFHLIDGGIGARLDLALKWLREGEEGKYRQFHKQAEEQFDYLTQSRLLEAIKANAAIDLIKQHHALGRKVVVWHDFNQGGGFAPFDFKGDRGDVITAHIGSGLDSKEITYTRGDFIDAFAKEFPDLVGDDLAKLKSPIEALKEAFPNAAFNNGTVSKKIALDGIRAFNDDSNPDANLIVVQSAKNAGWSAHDTTGKHMRVSINLGLPTSPTKPIQQEGRIYRTGQASDAAQRYLNTGTMFERVAFAHSISSRSGTVENLATGDFARDLKKSFIEAFQNSGDYPPGVEDGKGGKGQDRRDSTLSDFDRAVSFYYGQQKKNSRNKAAEGKDYFATPEPLGYKMVQWLDVKEGDSLAEPSAGHGAIARWFPENANYKVIEPSMELASRLSLVVNPSSVINDDFESHHISNKYDGIAMNPPFGSSGKLAMEHVAKAFGHLREGGRVVAIIPEGPAMDKRVNDWLTATLPNGKLANPDAHFVESISLPSSTFERAGTAVRTRVVIIDRNKGTNDGSGAETHANFALDKRLANAGSVEDLFEAIRDVDMPPRAAAPADAAPAAAPGVTNYEHGRVVDDASKAVYSEVGGKLETDAPVVKVTTAKGKVLDGVIVPDRSLAVSIDPHTYKPKGHEGFLVRMKYVVRPKADAPAVFSRGKGEAVPTALRISIPDLVQLVDNHLHKFATKIPVEVRESVAELGMKDSEGNLITDAKGLTHNGTIYLFNSRLASIADARDTLFHELFHLGVRRFLTRSQFVTTMGELYRNDPRIKMMADAWIKSEEGKDEAKLATSTPEFIRARGVDEALAHMSDRVNSTKSGFVDNTLTHKAMRAYMRVVAKIAHWFGDEKKAEGYRGILNDGARKTIKDIFGRMVAGEAAHRSTDVNAGPAYAMAPKQSAWNPTPLHQHAGLSPIEAIKSMRDGYSSYVGIEVEKMPSTPIGDSIKKIFVPTARGTAASETAGIIRANLGEQARGREVAMERLKETAAMFDKLPVSDSYRFIDNMERGVPNGLPKLDAAAKALHDLLEERRLAVTALGKGQLENFNENYFPHIWVQKRTASSFFSRSSMEGSKDFLKQRKHEFFSDGLHAGLDPVTTNPVELVLLKAREMDRYIYGQRIFNEMKRSGLVKYVKFGAKAPDGFAKINDKIARVSSYSDVEKSIVVRGEYYAPEKAATIINNHLSPGLAGNGFYDMWRSAGAAMNAAQLGLSAFHLGFTTMDVMVSKVSLGVKQISRGDVLQGAGSVAMGVTPAQPFLNLYKGDKLLRAYLGKLNDPELAPIVDALMQAGGRVKMDDFYRNTTVNGFKQALRKGKYGSALAKALPRALDLLNKPIFEYLVPRQKLGVFFDMAQDALAKKPNMTIQEKRDVLGKLWDSVDNRMGELVYDNVFWNKALKDGLMASVRSVGWNLGTFREIGGGIKDLKSVVSEKALSDRSAYLIALPFVAAVFGALIQYLYTGEEPKSLKDAFFPRTGKIRPDQSEDRISLPSYIKDIYEYGHDITGFLKYGADPTQTLRNKAHPLLSTVGDMLNNKDFFGANIRSPGDPGLRQVQDEAEFLAKQMTPFSIRNYAKQNKVAGKDGSVLDYVTSPQFIGLGAAPGYITKSAQQLESGEVSRQSQGLQAKFRQELKDSEKPEEKMEVVKRMRSAGLTDAQIRHVAASSGDKRKPTRPKQFGLGQ